MYEDADATDSYDQSDQDKAGGEEAPLVCEVKIALRASFESEPGDHGEDEDDDENQRPERFVRLGIRSMRRHREFDAEKAGFAAGVEIPVK